MRSHSRAPAKSDKLFFNYHRNQKKNGKAQSEGNIKSLTKIRAYEGINDDGYECEVSMLTMLTSEFPLRAFIVPFMLEDFACVFDYVCKGDGCAWDDDDDVLQIE